MSHRAPDTRRAAIAATAYVLLTLIVACGWSAGFDYQATVWLQRWGRRWLDYALFGFTLLGGIEATSLAVLALGVWRAAARRARAALALWTAFVVMTLVEVACKLLVTQPHVPDEFHRSPWEGVGFVHVSLPHAFPSGHTLRTIFILGYVWVLAGRASVAWRGPLRVALAAGMLLVGVSRVYLGEHWTTDVVGGVLLAVMGLWWVRRAETVAGTGYRNTNAQ